MYARKDQCYRSVTQPPYYKKIKYYFLFWLVFMLRRGGISSFSSGAVARCIESTGQKTSNSHLCAE